MNAPELSNSHLCKPSDELQIICYFAAYLKQILQRYQYIGGNLYERNTRETNNRIWDSWEWYIYNTKRNRINLRLYDGVLIKKKALSKVKKNELIASVHRFIDIDRYKVFIK